MCHTPPGFGHTNLFKLNTNKYRTNRTRKNVFRNLTNRADTVYYIDTHVEGVPTARADFFSSWESVPSASMDVLWSQHCPNMKEFMEEETTRLRSGEPYLEIETSKFWLDVLKHASRILKPGGKLIFPYKNDWDGYLSDPVQIMLIARIINMEANPDFLYGISFVKGFSPKLKELVILDKTNTIRKRNNGGDYHVSEWGYLVFEVPPTE